MKVKNLIIGAGISGLTYSLFSGNDDYLIVEKENEPGGYCRTIKRNGYVWDYAGHFFHFKNDEFKNLFMNSISKKDIVTNEKCTKIIYKNSLIDFPFQSNIHQLSKKDFIDCLYDLFNKNEKEKYDNFLDMLYGKFGKSIVEMFLKPYNEKLYAVDLKKLDVDAMGRFFPYANKEEIINNMKKKKVESYNNTFLYPKNGAGSFINILYNKLDESKVLLNTSLVSVDIDKKIAKLSNGQRIEYDNLINTIPLNKFLKILKSYDDIIEKMTFNKLLVLNIGFDKAPLKCKKVHWVYDPSKKCNFYRAGFYNNILKTEKLSMYIEIGYEKNFIIDQKETNKQLLLTLENLKNYKIIDDTFTLVDYEPIIMDPAYVHITGEINDLLLKVKTKLKDYGIYTIGRYGAWIYNSMEDSMSSAKELAESLNKGGK